MNKPGIKELLIDCVLDQQRLLLIQNQPDCIFEEYDLDEEARDILTNPDQRLLKPLGSIIQHQFSGNQQANNSTETDSADRYTKETTDKDRESLNTIPIPESRLALRLVPYLLQETETSDTAEQNKPLTVNYAASLDQLPAGESLTTLAEVPPADLPGKPLSPLVFIITVQPMVSSDAEGNQQITFSLTAQLPQDEKPPHTANKPVQPQLTPWGHDTQSSLVKTAAEKVLIADTENRYEQLLKLINTMVAPASETETNS